VSSNPSEDPKSSATLAENRTAFSVGRLGDGAARSVSQSEAVAALSLDGIASARINPTPSRLPSRRCFVARRRTTRSGMQGGIVGSFVGSLRDARVPALSPLQPILAKKLARMRCAFRAIATRKIGGRAMALAAPADTLRLGRTHGKIGHASSLIPKGRIARGTSSMADRCLHVRATVAPDLLGVHRRRRVQSLIAAASLGMPPSVALRAPTSPRSLLARCAVCGGMGEHQAFINTSRAQ
jgi:hypothetical protein